MQLTDYQITKLANAIAEEVITTRDYADDVAWSLYAEFFVTPEQSDDVLAGKMFELFGYDQVNYPAQLGKLTPSQIISLGEWIEECGVDNLRGVFIVGNGVFVCNRDDYCDAKRLDRVIEDFMYSHSYGEARTILTRYIIDRVTAGEWKPTEQAIMIVSGMEL